MSDVQIDRDPFARGSLMRRLLKPFDRYKSCAWCGKSHAKFSYYWANDGGRNDDIEGVFCSVSCMRDYYS